MQRQMQYTWPCTRCKANYSETKPVICQSQPTMTIHIVIWYDYTANYACSVPIKNHSNDKLPWAYKSTYTHITISGTNYSSTKWTTSLHPRVKNTKVQCTPPDMHHTNPAKQEISTWKNHFMAGMAGLPSSHPNWCWFTEQCNHTLNMMCPFCWNPPLSAFEAMEGDYSFDATPTSQPGTEVLVHLEPIQQCTRGTMPWTADTLHWP